MNYLAVFLGCYAITLFIATALIDARIAELLEDSAHSRHRTDSPECLAEIIATANRSKLVYGLATGTLLGMLISAGVLIG